MKKNEKFAVHGRSGQIHTRTEKLEKGKKGKSQNYCEQSEEKISGILCPVSSAALTHISGQLRIWHRVAELYL